MKREPESQRPRLVALSRRPVSDWRERYWDTVCTLLPQLREEPAIDTDDAPDPDPPTKRAA